MNRPQNVTPAAASSAPRHLPALPPATPRDPQGRVKVYDLATGEACWRYPIDAREAVFQGTASFDRPSPEAA